MNRSVEDAASRAFLEALLSGIEDGASHRVEYVVDELFPVLIPGIVHLLKAHQENQRRQREEEEDETEPPIQPLNHLARYLMRHNPRHAEPTTETAELKALARKLLRK